MFEICCVNRWLGCYIFEFFSFRRISLRQMLFPCIIMQILFIRRHIESSINLTSYPIRCKQFSFSKHRILPKKLLTLSMLSPRFNVIDRVENERGEFPRIPRLEKLKNIGLEKINFSHWRGELRDRQRPLEPDGRLSSLEGGAHARTYTRFTVCQPLFYDSAARLTAD